MTSEDGTSFHNEVYDLTFDRSQENSITVQLLKKLKILLEEEDRLENELRTDLDDIEDLHNGVFERGRPYKKYLLGFGIAWELLSLVGMNEFGLTVKIGSAVERGLRPNRFADALQEELELFQYSFLEGPTVGNSDLMNRLCLKALHREFEKYAIINKDFIDGLVQIASALHGSKKASSISKAAIGSVSVIGKILIITVLVLIPVTVGASVVLILVGYGIVGTSKLAEVGVKIAAMKKARQVRDATKTAKEKTLLKTIDNLMELSNSVSGGESSAIAAAVFPVLSTGASCVFDIVEKTVRAGKDVVKIGGAVVDVAFDVVALFDNWAALAKGSKSQLGYKL